MWWQTLNGSEIAQGDVIRGLIIPSWPDTIEINSDEPIEADVDEVDVIVVSQSCDLRKNDCQFAAVCPITTVEEYRQTAPPELRNIKAWNGVRSGKWESLHLLEGLNEGCPQGQRMVVDFRVVLSIPIGYLKKHAQEMGDRQRLLPPFLEHFSQAFARFLTRVGLPSGIPEFKAQPAVSAPSG